MNYSESIGALVLSLVNSFDMVYFNAEIVTNDKQERFPAIAKGDEWISLVPTDEKEILYVRRNGDDEAVSEFKIGACAKSYRMRTPLRVVFFKDNTSDHDRVLGSLMQSVLITGSQLKSVKQDKWRLMKEESSGDYNFGATTAYFAVELYLVWDLLPSSCAQDFCVDIVNPLNR